MKQGGDRAAKRRAGERAAEAVADGEVVGLGTGSTAAAAIRALGERVDAGLDLTGIPTSFQARQVALEAGVPLSTLEAATPDVAIDGADQVVLGTNADHPTALVKGGGAAHASEKVVDAAADRFLVVVDETKLAAALDAPVPLAVLPDAHPTVAQAIGTLGGEATLRSAERKDGPVVTEHGNLVLDADLGAIASPARLAADLDAIPGLVAHGLFVDLADAVYVGEPEGGVRVEGA
jgi:ribose 5-phosphate isomerase A